MAAAKARRTGRSILAVTTTLTVTLAAAAPGLAPAGSAAAPGRPHAHAADACDGSVGLQVSDRRPLQLRPVRVAAISSVPADAVVFYDFNYGDGSDDAGAQPNAVHAYQDTGAYAVKVTAVTTCNTMVSSPELRVVVGDGLPPDVAIGFPHADQTAHFGRAGLLLQGTARDPSGVRKVELAMQVLRVTRSATRAGAAGATAAATTPKTGCYWYDGHVKLRARGCASPLFFPVHVTGTHWSFRMNPRSQIPPGVYTARVRATDRHGNASTIFSPKLGDILAFKLVA
jgi:hypothetical protein